MTLVTHLSYETLLALHVYLMRDVMEEVYYGVLDRRKLESALARPFNAAQCETASPIRQAAYLFQGLLMNHGFVQGNKRTAYLALEWFLAKNNRGEVMADDNEIIQMCLSAENDKWTIDAIEKWLLDNVR